MADDLRIIVLEGDETGQELLEQALRVLDPDVLDLGIDFDEHVAFVVAALEPHAEALGLAGSEAA